MNSVWLSNLIAWSAQVCVLTAVAAGAALALKNARARLLFWHSMLAVALLLPLIEPWTSLGGPSGEVTVSTGAGIGIDGPSVHRQFFFSSGFVLFLIAGGIAVRLLWIAVGFVRLRRHRLAARVLLHPPVPFENVNVRWYLSETVSGP